MRDQAASLIFAVFALVTGCGDAATPAPSPAAAGTSSGVSGNSSTGGAGGVGMTVIAGGVGGSSAGTDSRAGSGGGGGAGGAPSSAADGFPSADCAPGAIFCDGFESYPIHNPIFDANNNIYDLIATGETTPTWLAYHFHGPPRVDASKAFKGVQNMHLDTEAGDLRYADILKESPDGVELFPAAHYGRVMLWLKAMPQTSRFNIVHESGLLAGSTSTVAQFSLGGAKGKLAFSYSQYARIVKNAVGTKDRRGGGPQNGDPPPQVQCSVNATTQALSTMKWVCVEWMLDGAKSELHLWLDGVAQTEVDVTGGGGSCSIGTAATWQGPERLTELVLGWEAYEKDAPGQEAWYDEFAIGRQRLGCPAP